VVLDMKKIFFVSILFVMVAVSSVEALEPGWDASWSGNFNIATVEYVEAEAADAASRKLDSVIAQKTETVATGKTDVMVPTVARMESAISNATANIDMSTKVDKTSVVSSTGTVTSDDTQIPTIKRMESAIANAKPDTSGLVDKAAVVISGGGRTMTGGAVATDANKDAYVPTVAYAQEMATGAYNDAVSHIEGQLQGYVPTVTEFPDGILVTDSVGGVQVLQGVPTSITDAVEEQISVKLNKPIGECAEPGACALVFAGVDENGGPVLQWEKIARSVIQTTAE
jgi:hypothetical protein